MSRRAAVLGHPIGHSKSPALHLAAYALGVGASGMTFLDSEIAGLLGEPLAGLLFTCVGVPTYRNKGGGRPGEPAPVVVPAPGLTPPDALP